MSGKAKSILYVLLCVVLWALIPIVAKLGQTHLDNHQFLFWSSLMSFAVLFVTTLLTKKLAAYRSYDLKDWSFILCLGLLGTYIYYLFLYFGYANAQGLEVLVIQYTWPLFVVALSILILKERLTWRKTLAMTLGFIGVASVLTKGNYKSVRIENYLVIVLVGAGALCFALFSVLNKRVTKEPLGVTTIYFLSASIASFISMGSSSGLRLVLVTATTVPRLLVARFK